MPKTVEPPGFSLVLNDELQGSRSWTPLIHHCICEQTTAYCKNSDEIRPDQCLQL